MWQSIFALPAANDLLKKIDEVQKQTTDVKANVSLTQQKANQGVKTLEVLYYRRDSDRSFLIVMEAPESDKGNGYLRVADNFWMYRRNTRTFQHINRDESIGGSDAKGQDFEERSVTELYQPALDKDNKEKLSEEKLGQIAVYKFEVTNKVKDVSYPKKVYWVRTDNGLVLKEESYSSSNTLMQTAYYLKYTTLHGKYVPVEQLFIDEFEKGNKTKVVLSNIADDKLDDKIFTKAYLENLSK
jgi:isochorismate synthase EntC